MGWDGANPGAPQGTARIPNNRRSRKGGDEGRGPGSTPGCDLPSPGVAVQGLLYYIADNYRAVSVELGRV